LDHSTTVEEQALARGLIYRFVAGAYRYPESGTGYPQSGTGDAVRQQNRAISEALAALADSSDPQLTERFADLQAAAQTSTADTLENDYISLFGHAVQGRCPLYEAEYSESDERLQQPHELSDLSAFYRAFGLGLGEKVRERVDFLAVQCEFMAFLCVKQAYAEEHREAELAAATVDAGRKFLCDHLGRWVPAAARRIIDQSQHGYYSALAHFTLAYVRDDCRRLDVTPGSEHLKLLLPLKEADACPSCPMAQENPDANSGPNSLPEA
jgi:DMSO reductase family type II enzyme chaperone